MIHFGENGDIPQLKHLWKECFADEDAYIDAFFHALYKKEDVLLAQEKGMLLGASFFLPGSIYIMEGTEGCWQPVRYVYALAVYPQHRGRGLAGRLLQEASRIYRAPLIAEPAEEGLIGGFYEPLGFSGAFYLKKQQRVLPQQDVRAAQASGRVIRKAGADAYCRVRDSHFRMHGYVRWPKEHAAFAIAQHRENGGDALLISDTCGSTAKTGREDILLYYVEEESVIVTETTLSDKDVEQVLTECLTQPCRMLVLTGGAALSAKHAVQPAAVSAQAGMQPEPDRNVQAAESRIYLTGMALGMPGVHGYLNLTLD